METAIIVLEAFNFALEAVILALILLDGKIKPRSEKAAEEKAETEMDRRNAEAERAFTEGVSNILNYSYTVERGEDI